MRVVNFKLLLILVFIASSQSISAQTLHKALMSFRDASAPYEGTSYNSKNGYVGRDGKIKNGGLGCGSYASVVLQRMRHGKDWLKYYDVTLHYDYGGIMAKKFGLDEIAKLQPFFLESKERTKILIDSAQVKAGALYYFNIRNGAAGHVGFLRFSATGEIQQYHYSGMDAYKGFAKGDFRKWFFGSQYKASEVQLWFVPE